MLDMILADPPVGYGQLRTPGVIQSFGVMLTLHPRTLRVLAASENVGTELGVPHAQVIGQRLPDLLGGEAAAELTAAAAEEVPSFMNPVPAEIGGRKFDMILHAHDGVIFAELEPLAPGAPIRADLDRLGDSAITGMIVPGDLAALLEAAPVAIRNATDFDRVLLYRFDEAYRGQVVGEARRAGVDSFLGLFFPESDIGPPARALYEQNFCRYIPQIAAPAVRVVPGENPLTGRKLDMSLAGLRGVAPCHVEYLTNMGVAASMSFSIISEGRLWGLFACHHYQPARLSYTQRLVCEQIAMMFTARLEELINPATREAEMAQLRARVLATSPVLNADPIAQAWTPQDEAALLAVVGAEGAAIYDDGKVGQIGACPDLAPLHAHMRSEPEAFDRMVRMYDENGLFFTNCVASTVPFGEAMRERGSGMMIIPLARNRRTYLLWFRPELVVKANWAGDPGVGHGTDASVRFSPRKSFATWKEDIRDRAEPWLRPEINNAVALRDAALARHG